MKLLDDWAATGHDVYLRAPNLAACFTSTSTDCLPIDRLTAPWSPFFSFADRITFVVGIEGIEFEANDAVSFDIQTCEDEDFKSPSTVFRAPLRLVTGEQRIEIARVVLERANAGFVRGFLRLTGRGPAIVASVRVAYQG